MRGTLFTGLSSVFVVSAWSVAHAQGPRTDTNDAATADSAARLAPLVFSDDPEVRWAAIEALWERKPDGQLAGALAYAIEHDLAPAHKAWLISRIRPDDVYTPLMLDRLAEREDLRVRLAAIEAIAVIRTPDKKTVTLLARLGEDPTPQVRIAAIAALLRLKKADDDTVLWALDRLRQDPATANKIAILGLLQDEVQQSPDLQKQLEGLRASCDWLTGDEAYRACLRDLRGIIQDQRTLRRRIQQTRKAELRRLAAD